MKVLRWLLPLLSLASPLIAQQFNPSLYQEMRWRMIGPFRGGRTVAATGIPGQQNVFYIGVNNGGAWKSTDFGHTWQPIFDGQPTGSIGALAVAPSNPDIIYIGSGEGLQRPDLSTGNGIYKSTDAGKTWQHLGLRDGWQIPVVLVDPRDPNRVFAAVLGHPYGPNQERGVFRSTDGGKTWQKILYKDENTGAVDLAFDPKNSQTLYAVLWSARRPPWTTGGSILGPGSGLFKSTDGGNTWQPLTQGLPTWAEGLGRIGLGIAPSNPNRIYATVQADAEHGGLYRSDDAGQTWNRVNNENRVYGRADDFAEVKVDPRNPDVVYVANTSTYRSTDGGTTFTAIKGAPGGDDYHRIWINPENPDIILLAADQGATLTVNGGADLEFVVQPADGAVLSRHHRRPFSLLGVRRAAGERLGRHRQPQRLRRDHLSRLAHRGRRGVRLRRARSAESQLHLRRQSIALRPNHHADAGRFAGRAAHREVPLQSHRAAHLFPGGQARALSRLQRAVQDHQRRPELADHQPRPDARASRRSAEPGQLRRQRKDRTSRRHLQHRAVVQGCEH